MYYLNRQMWQSGMQLVKRMTPRGFRWGMRRIKRALFHLLLAACLVLPMPRAMPHLRFCGVLPLAETVLS